MDCEAVILCNADSERLYPFTSEGHPDCLLPVLTRPLVSYPLASLKAANVQHVLLVVKESLQVQRVRSWLSKESEIPLVEVVTIEDEATTADALRLCLPLLSSSTVMVIKLGIVTELPLSAMLIWHASRRCSATVLLRKRKSSAAAATKAGRIPKGVDYIGWDHSNWECLHFQPHSDSIRTVNLNGDVLRKHSNVQITTNFLDGGVYVISKDVLSLFEERIQWKGIANDLIPFLVRNAVSQAILEKAETKSFQISPSFDATEKSPQLSQKAERNLISVYFAKEGEYVSMIDSVQSFADVTKELMSSSLRTTLAGLPASNQESIIFPTAQLENKATVSGWSILCEGVHLSENASVKRSFIGRNTRIGGGCKIVNSVILDHVVIGDHVHIQSSVVGSGCEIGSSAQIKDAQIGPNAKIEEKSECIEETISCD